MKYIRTKDHWICKVKNEDERTISYENSWESGCLWKESYKDKIQYADTIEELCDLFIDTTGLKGIADGWRFDGYDKSKKALWWISTSETTRYIPISEWNDKTAIKGAIWTDKGLIYVAKMNDKGEFELI